MTKQWEKATLATIKDGEAIDRVNYELDRVIANCKDINTNPDTVRVITLKIRVKPTKDREQAAVTYEVSSKVAPDAPGTVHLQLVGDGDEAQGFVPVMRQLDFDDYQSNPDATRSDVLNIQASRAKEG